MEPLNESAECTTKIFYHNYWRSYAMPVIGKQGRLKLLFTEYAFNLSYWETMSHFLYNKPTLPQLLQIKPDDLEKSLLERNYTAETWEPDKQQPNLQDINLNATAAKEALSRIRYLLSMNDFSTICCYTLFEFITSTRATDDGFEESVRGCSKKYLTQIKANFDMRKNNEIVYVGSIKEQNEETKLKFESLSTPLKMKVMIEQNEENEINGYTILSVAKLCIENTNWSQNKQDLEEISFMYALFSWNYRFCNYRLRGETPIHKNGISLKVTRGDVSTTCGNLPKKKKHSKSLTKIAKYKKTKN